MGERSVSLVKIAVYYTAHLALEVKGWFEEREGGIIKKGSIDSVKVSQGTDKEWIGIFKAGSGDIGALAGFWRAHGLKDHKGGVRGGRFSEATTEQA